MREDISLLLGNGHPACRRYPLWQVALEVEIVRDRINALIATEAVVLQAAVSSILSKDAAKAFTKLVEAMRDG